MSILNTLFYIAAITIFDRFTPDIVRMYGVNFMPWGDEEQDRIFIAEYGIISWPRTIAAALSIVMFFVTDNISTYKDYFAFAFILTMLIWGLVMSLDIFRAAKKAKE